MKNNTLKIMLILVICSILLVSFRLMWLNHFSEEKVAIEQGEVDLSSYELGTMHYIELQGEWNFYPYELLTDIPKQSPKDETYVTVPGDWSEILNKESKNDSFGYGTYHLRILVDPNKDDMYSLRMSSIRSASAVYVNGHKIGESGKVSDKKSSYDAFNVPYTTSSIRPNEDGVIDIFVQASNFTDPRQGGIVRSVKFGSSSNIKQMADLSTILQVITGVVFLFHGLFALIIYIIGVRDKRILYFSLALLSFTLINLNTGDEKVMLQYIQLDYIFSLKAATVLMYLFAICLVLIIKDKVNRLFKTIIRIFSRICMGLIIATILLPINYLTIVNYLTFAFVFIAIIIVFTVLLTKQPYQKNIWLLIAVLALFNNFFWGAFSIVNGVKAIYYPFDLIIAVICIGSLWFNHYYDMHIKIREQAKQLKKADKEKDLFLANTAHEIKNPLHSILNMADAVLERESDHLQKESKKDLETVLAVSKRMTILVNDLLEMSLLDDHKPKLFIRKTSLQGVAEGVIHMNEYLLEKKDVKIVNRINMDFPYVLADENRLTQIMYNLVHNAVKFTEQGTITIEADVEDGMAYISVTDTGIGIDEKVLSELFLPYRQGTVPYKANEVGGLGLGLYISKQLVEYMDGQIDVQSTIGEGSTFTFTLPIGDEAGTYEHKSFMKHNEEGVHKGEVFTDQGILLDAQDIGKIGYASGKDWPKVIVVDDDPINLRVMEVVLHNEQYDVTTVLSGSEVMQLLDHGEYDLVISDVMMPHMSGFELTKNIRKRFTMSDLPILLLTSRDRIRDVKHGFDVGANDYITKPIDAIELKARVKALTEVRIAARESLYLEAAFLQAQIQPHFIFNTINSIFALSEIDIKQMQKLLEAFSDVLRSKFQFKTMKEFVDLKQELQLIEAYLYIEQVRFGDRVKVVWEIDDYKNVRIPAITIQPLVENAILHGITTRSSGGTITIKVIDREKEIEIIVEDDGVGIPKDILDRIHKQERVGTSGVGIYNTNLRLLRTYGKGLHIESEEGKGTKVSFKIPKEEPNQQ